MRIGRLSSASLVLLFLGCATAEPIDDTGIAGAAGAAAGGGSGGKVDNPNDGGATGGGGADTGGVGGATGGGAGLGGGGTGGVPSGGAGGTPSGGGTGGSACPTGQKKCGGVCIPPSPGVGCSDTDCTPCPSPPANANSICTGTLCDFSCLSGYVKSGSSCVSTGGGGSGGGVGGSGGGSSGTGGGGGGCPAPCDPSDPGAQFLCAFFCAASGQSLGLCAPVINCCTCT